jgi:hypothetical protein
MMGDRIGRQYGNPRLRGACRQSDYERRKGDREYV